MSNFSPLILPGTSGAEASAHQNEHAPNGEEDSLLSDLSGRVQSLKYGADHAGAPAKNVVPPLARRPKPHEDAPPRAPQQINIAKDPGQSARAVNSATSISPCGDQDQDQVPANEGHSSNMSKNNWAAKSSILLQSHQLGTKTVEFKTNLISKILVSVQNASWTGTRGRGGWRKELQERLSKCDGNWSRLFKRATPHELHGYVRTSRRRRILLVSFVQICRQISSTACRSPDKYSSFIREYGSQLQQSLSLVDRMVETLEGIFQCHDSSAYNVLNEIRYLTIPFLAASLYCLYEPEDHGRKARQLDLVRVRAILLITSWLDRLAVLQTGGATQMPRVLSKRTDHGTHNNGEFELERRKNIATLRTCLSSIHTQLHEAMTKILEQPKRLEEARSNASQIAELERKTREETILKREKQESRFESGVFELMRKARTQQKHTLHMGEDELDKRKMTPKRRRVETDCEHERPNKSQFNEDAETEVHDSDYHKQAGIDLGLKDRQFILRHIRTTIPHNLAELEKATQKSRKKITEEIEAQRRGMRIWCDGQGRKYPAWARY